MTVQELQEAFRLYFKDQESFEKWMSEPNRAFDFKSPNELIASNDTERLEAALYYLDSGIAS